MDLDDFDLDETQNTSELSQVSDASQALKFIDGWYAERNRRARRMDLIGDYAGSEPFIVDGESLLQNVLDDSLLAIGRVDEPSYQILHAKRSLEYTLEQFLTRSAVFDVVFFEENRHLTLKTGSDEFVVASRALARRHLYTHLTHMDIPTKNFKSIQDPEWMDYCTRRKPMFIMVNDGGTSGGTNLETMAIVIQRGFLFRAISQGIPIVLLRGTDFRDSKILSFVFEQGLVIGAGDPFPKAVSKWCFDALQSLDLKESQTFARPLIPLDFAPKKEVSSIEEIYQPLLQVDDTPPEIIWAFLTHIFIVPRLSAHDRARKYQPTHPLLHDLLLKRFLPRVFASLEYSMSQWNIDIDVDGNIFTTLLHVVLSTPDLPLQEIIGQEILSRVESICPSPVGLKELSQRFPSPISKTNPNPNTTAMRLLPFDHEVFNEELSFVQVPVNHDGDNPFGELEFGKDTIFDDRFHWHNHNRLILPKHLGGDDPKPKDAWQRQKLLKRNQRFMAKLGRDAGTLTGALGARFDRITITMVGKTQSGKGPSAHPRIKAIQNVPTKKGKKESSKEKLLKEIKKQKTSVEDDESQRWWSQKLQELSKMTSEVRSTHLKDLTRNSRTTKGWLSVEVRLLRLHYILTDWVSNAPESEQGKAQDEYRVSIMRLVKEIYETKDLTTTAHNTLSSVLTVLGFEDYIPSFTTTTEDHSLSFEFIKLIRSKSKKPAHKFMRITEDPIEWQLRLFGEFMDRSMDSKPDARVAFEPDRWQRDVLDCLDRNESVLVVAPTSAGKTFISFYAMEQTLRESDDGILVYVAPTKALVAQISAEIYARFSKELQNGTCWAVHTRDYRVHDPQKCQILVTVPEMLSIMMLSPPLAKTWLPRIKRIVMDEIHTIGQQEGGAVWEQILLLAPCPVIGLSATIGEPESFNKWLESVQKAHGFKHTFIHHPHRYSHLRKFHYLLHDSKPSGSEKKFEGITKHQSTDRMRFLHPITMLSFGARSMPPDLSLEARDTLLLYQALKSTPGALSPEEVEELEPTRYFRNVKRMLRQEDILRYEVALKNPVSRLILSSTSAGPSSILTVVTGKLADPKIKLASEVALNVTPEKSVFLSQLIQLLSDLHAQGDLPALLFNFDRSYCERMAYDLLERLEDGEDHWRSSAPEWQRKVRAHQLWLAKAKQRERQADRASRQKTDEDAPVEGVADSSWEASFDPDEPSPQFSFAGTSAYSKADLQKEIDDLARWSSTDPRALRALRRGIGIHHAGMNKGYRSLVESLFRQGFLRVVIATGTLALGINAPTKTSVFCGDSPFLTALMYRQCAGRAGRRGYDLLGKVVFYGLAFDRVQRLVLSKLPSLGGNFPLTSTLVLRLFNLIEGSDSAPVAVNAVKSLLKLPQIVWGSEQGEHQFLHHVRFSIEYLRRARLLDYQGKPMNLFGIAAHLYYTEPSNLALVALIRAGVLHKVCGNPNTINAKKDFIILMAHLFGRRYLPRVYTTDANIKEVIKKSASLVLLPKLDARARKVLLAHEKEILRIFESYALTYAEQNANQLGPDDELPLSKVRYSGTPSSDSGTFITHLRETRTRVVARSVFVANSGHVDTFQSVGELARTTRAGLHLNEHAIPSMAAITALSGDDDGEGGEVFELNAYLYDFYMHGQVATLAKDNGIRRGDVWYLLQDFTLSLMTIRGVLEQLLLRAAQDTSNADDGSDAGFDVDSGYGGSDPAERDKGEDAGLPGFLRPVGVSDKDWRVYQIVNEALAEFDVKFKAMWA